MKRFVVLLLCLSLTFSLTACGPSMEEPPEEVTPTPSPTPTPTPTPTPEPWPEAWQEGYRRILEDWTVIEGYGDLSYLPAFFGDEYGFDAYFLCDVEGDGTPELFLDSSTMGLAAALRYDAGPVRYFMMTFSALTRRPGN